MGNRTYTPAETRLLAEYLVEKFPHVRTLQHVRVGPIDSYSQIPDLTEAESRMLGVWRRYVDALVFQPGHVLVVEATIFPEPGYVSRLIHYCRLFPQTPEFEEFRRFPVRGLLVAAVHDPTTAAMAEEFGVDYDEYRPPWVLDYLKTVQPRKWAAVQNLR